MKRIFSSKAVNTERQSELDFVKGIAIITMIICHTVGIMGEIPDHVGYIVADEILGGPMAAPMFMLCMGIGINFSRRNTPLSLFRRGASIFLLAYILNFTRSALPIVLGFAIPSTPYNCRQVDEGSILRVSVARLPASQATPSVPQAAWADACTVSGLSCTD